mmetsp:Transcript_1678/g.3167  ORF Transcript_1678/g.3167 Transcript_1678/m.3167 type:complete len:207 (-) Transcript_1678:174-794(-)
MDLQIKPRIRLPSLIAHTVFAMAHMETLNFARLLHKILLIPIRLSRRKIYSPPILSSWTKIRRLNSSSHKNQSPNQNRSVYQNRNPRQISEGRFQMQTSRMWAITLELQYCRLRRLMTFLGNLSRACASNCQTCLKKGTVTTQTSSNTWRMISFHLSVPAECAKSTSINCNGPRSGASIGCDTKHAVFETSVTLLTISKSSGRCPA